MTMILAKRSAPLLPEAREDSLKSPGSIWPHFLATGSSGHQGIPAWLDFSALTWLCKAFLTSHFGPVPSKQGTDPLCPSCMTVSVCNPAARTCHLTQCGLVQHTTDGQLRHPLELSARKNGKDYRGWGTKLELRILHPFTSPHRTWWHCWTEWRPQLWSPARWSIRTSPGMPKGERNMWHPCTQRTEALKSRPVSPPVLRMFVNL